MTPTTLPAYSQIRGSGDDQVDSWSVKILLDPAFNWAASTFEFDSRMTGIVLDVTHKAANPAYVTLSAPASVINAWPYSSFEWNLAEKPILARTFVDQTVQLITR